MHACLWVTYEDHPSLAEATYKDGTREVKALSNSTVCSAREPMGFSGPLLVARMKIKTQQPPQASLL